MGVVVHGYSATGSTPPEKLDRHGSTAHGASKTTCATCKALKSMPSLKHLAMQYICRAVSPICRVMFLIGNVRGGAVPAISSWRNAFTDIASSCASKSTLERRDKPAGLQGKMRRAYLYALLLQSMRTSYFQPLPQLTYSCERALNT